MLQTRPSAAVRLPPAREFYRLCKPRITALIVFTAAVGMLIAAPEPPAPAVVLATLCGIAFVSGASAAFNGLLEKGIDARMRRTRYRPLPIGSLSVTQAAAFALALSAAGLWLLYRWVNPLTAWLTCASLLGYSLVYTLLLKPRTAQNIVLGGAAGAMPPVLGWAAATNSVGVEAIILFLIVFAWTPPHFWALALYHRRDYAGARIPMLPVVRGEVHTRVAIFVYVCLLTGLSLAPYALGTTGYLYLCAALALDARFLHYAWRLISRYHDRLALATFRYSITYLFLLFSGLLLDHMILK